MRGTAERLLEALQALPVTVDTAEVSCGAVRLESYPGGARPHAIVSLQGRGRTGIGEHVGWTRAHHDALRACAGSVPCGTTTVGAFSRSVALAFSDPYDRAALEAAAIDLALRQHATTVTALAGSAAAAIRYVVSFDASADPRTALTTHARAELKLDVAPAWSDTVLARFADSGRVAVLDWKGTGERPAHERAHAYLPAAFQEDPGDGRPLGWSAGFYSRVSVDRPLACADDFERLPLRPAAVNVKPARMGGVLEALRLAARLDKIDVPFYLGGMFEVGVGRTQLHALAAVLCPDGPNDVAPLCGPAATLRADRLEVPTPAAGFGGGTA